MGFDHALWLGDHPLWGVHGLSQPYRGVVLARHPWLPNVPKRRLPNFRFNCFLQAKRPEIGSRLPKRLSRLGKGRPFFKFAIDAAQQTTVASLAERAKGKALFVYAAPVFGRSRDLFSLAIAGMIFQRSTFPDVSRMGRHRAFYYNTPGNFGLANPEYEEIEFPSLQDRIAQLIAGASEISDAQRDPYLNLQRLEADILSVVNSESADPARSAYLLQEWRQIDRIAEMGEMPSALSSFLRVEAFCRYFNLLWLVIPEAR